MQKEFTPPDLREKGRLKDGTVIYSDRRLWMQFLSFTNCYSIDAILSDLQKAKFKWVLYLDLNDPWGIGLLRFSEDPDFFVGEGRSFLLDSQFSSLTYRPEFAMTGRTYAVGYEGNLDEILIERPIARVMDQSMEWAIWYPVKREKDFESLSPEQKHEVMMDHGDIGMKFGKSGLAHDIRLSCHGLDFADSDFIIGILSDKLFNASAVVQAMRKSLQTMHHIESLGPFFIGKAFARG